MVEGYSHAVSIPSSAVTEIVSSLTGTAERSSRIWFSYIHNFIIILSRVYNEPIQRPAPSWLVSLIGHLHDDVILLQLPESLSLLFSCAN